MVLVANRGAEQSLVEVQLQAHCLRALQAPCLHMARRCYVRCSNQVCGVPEDPCCPPSVIQAVERGLDLEVYTSPRESVGSGG